MDFKPFKLDIDELINDFAKVGSTTLAEMKRIWLSKKFSFLFEASPSTNQACFMQSLYAHAIGYLVSTSSLSHRVGGLYCLYCLFETQPFKPPFKIYLSLGELKRLKHLVLDTKEKNIKVVSALVKHMLDRHMFLFGFVDMNEGSVTERINELTDIQNTSIQVAYKKLFANTKIEDFMHMNLGTELEVDLVKKVSSDYATAKELAIKEAGKVVDIKNIKHIAEDKQLIGDLVEKTAKDWDVEKDLFYQQTGFCHQPVQPPPEQEGNSLLKRKKGTQISKQMEEGNGISCQQNHENINDQGENENFGKELEEALLSLPREEDDEAFEDKEMERREICAE